MYNTKLRHVCACFCSILSAFLSTVYIFADRSTDIDTAGGMLSAMNGNNTAAFLVFVIVAVFFYKVYCIEGKRLKILAAIGGFIFSAMEMLGHNISCYDSIFRINNNIFTLSLDAACFFGAFCLFTGALVFLFHLVLNKRLDGKIKCKWFDCNWKSFFVVFGVLLCSYACYYFIFFPGITKWDSYYQIEQGMGFRQLTDENPFLHTLLIGSIIKLGASIFGTIADGIAVYTAIQMILISLAVSFMLMFMAKRGVNIWLRLLTLAFFALHPAIAAYSVTNWKDIWLAYFLLLYVMLLIEIAYNRELFFKSKWHVTLLILVICGFLFTKNVGIYVFLLTLPFLWIYARKNYKQLIAVTLVCLSVFMLARTVVIPQLGITKGHIREAYSVPLQQIARTVTRHGDDLTEEQKQIIDEILPYDELASLYQPNLSDNVKGALNEEVFGANRGKYLKLWIELGLKHPKTYVESFLANTYGYWYPETKYWQISKSSYYDILFMYRDNDWNVYDEDVDNYVADQSSDERRDTFVDKYNALRDVPIVSTVFSLAIYFWLALVLMLICILKKKYKMLLPFTVVMAILIICLISPVHAEYRYAFPAIISIPLLFSFSVQDDFEFTLKMGIEKSSLKS